MLRMTVLLLIAASTLSAQTPAWRITGLANGEYLISIDSAVSHGGRRSVRIEGLTATPMSTATVLQSIRVGQLRGKRVRLSAYIKTQDVSGTGAAVAVGAAAANSPGSQGMSMTPWVNGSTDWKLVSTEVDVHEAMAALLVTLNFKGQGTTWIDDLSVEAVGDAVFATAPALPPAANAAAATQAAAYLASLPDVARELGFETTILGSSRRSPLEAPRALTARGLDNVIAFARVAGVVRHFHPTNAVRTTNWDDFLIRGVRAVERAPNADSLARTLNGLFSGVAPQVRVSAGAPPKFAPAPRPAPGDRLGVAHWSNLGLTMAAPNPQVMNVYASVLMEVPAPDGRVPQGVPSPDSAWTATLPGGVSAVVPIALWIEKPAAGLESRQPMQPVAPMEAATPNDRAVRLAGVIGAWNVFQHAYPYFDVVGVDWNAELARALKAAASDRTPDDYLGTLRRLVAAARDGHGGVYPLVGPGRMAFLPVALDWVENQLVVTRTSVGAPPDIKRGDVVELIDGVKAGDVLAGREEQISSATPQWRRHRALSDLLAGAMGTHTDLRLRSGTTVRLTYASALVVDSLPEKISEVRPGIYYVDFSRITDADFGAALSKLVAARGVVFDMRGYPRTVSTPNILSHLTNDTTRSARFQVPIITRPDRQATTYRQGGWPVPPQTPRIPGKIAFLTGGGAVSYAETTMGIVEAFKLGEIVGETTAGTNGNVNSFVATGGYNIAYTGMLVLKHDGSTHHGVGIKATIPAPRTIRGVAEGRDEALERAIVAVGGRATVVP